MKIVLIGAMHKEIVHILDKLVNYHEETINNFTYYLGKYDKHEIILTESGIGKVMAGMLVTSIYHNFKNIDYVISLGVAGGFNGVDFLDVIACKNSVFGDVDISSSGEYEYGQMQGFPRVFEGDKHLLSILESMNCMIADICTSDRFMVDLIATQKLCNEHFSDLNIKCVDMETAAFAQACHFYNLKYIAIKAISDLLHREEQITDYNKIVNKACDISSEIVLELLKKL